MAVSNRGSATLRQQIRASVIFVLVNQMLVHLFVAGWITTAVLLLLNLATYRGKYGNFSQLQQFLSETGETTSRSRLLFVLFGVAASIMTTLSFFACYASYSAPGVFYVPVVLSALAMVVGFVLPNDTHAVAHAVGIGVGMVLIGVAFCYLGLSMASTAVFVVGAVVLVAMIVYVAYGTAQYIPAHGIDPALTYDPALQKGALVILLVGVTFVAYVASTVLHS